MSRAGSLKLSFSIAYDKMATELIKKFAILLSKLTLSKPANRNVTNGEKLYTL